VTEEEYRRVCGEQDWQLEKRMRNAENADPHSPLKYDENSPWLIYPDDLMRNLGAQAEMRVTLTVAVVATHLDCGCTMGSNGKVSAPIYMFAGPESSWKRDLSYYCEKHAPEGAKRVNPEEI
jgi:hypothetical protein